VRKPGKLKWEGDRLILEIDTTIRVPIELDPVIKPAIKDFQHDLRLTHREQQTLAGILKGATNKEIASELCISERTVKFHVSSLLLKFKVHTRGEIVFRLGANRNADPNV